MKKRKQCLAILLMVSLPILSQEPVQWTLDKCIDYALENNIQLQQSKITMKESEVDVKSAKASLFPSLSFSTGHNINNRPYQENMNMISGSEVISSSNNTTYSGNYGLNAQWTVWDGNKKLNNIKQRETALQISSLAIDEVANSLQEQIAQVFVQILYANESVKINENTLEVSKATYERGVQMFNIGSLSKADLAQLEAQVSNDQYQLTVSKSSLNEYKLQLKQLLELDGSEEMVLVLPELSDEDILLPLSAQEEIYQQALVLRPEIRSGELSIENSKLEIGRAHV